MTHDRWQTDRGSHTAPRQQMLKDVGAEDGRAAYRFRLMNRCGCGIPILDKLVYKVKRAGVASLSAGCMFIVSVAGVCWLVGCLASQQHACVSQGRIYSDNCTCCHTEIEAADQTISPSHSILKTGPTSPNVDPITPGAWQGSHWSANFLSHWYDSTRKNPVASRIRTPDLLLSGRTP